MEALKTLNIKAAILLYELFPMTDVLKQFFWMQNKVILRAFIQSLVILRDILILCFKFFTQVYLGLLWYECIHLRYSDTLVPGLIKITFTQRSKICLIFLLYNVKYLQIYQ